MTADDLARTMRDFLDGEYDDGNEVDLSVRAEGASVVVEVTDARGRSRTFRAVLVEIEGAA